MKPNYKIKMRQKQRKRARANRAESKESNKPKIPSAERMRKLRECRKAETSCVASEPGVASISRAEQAMDIDTGTEQFIQSHMVSTQYVRRSLCNSHDSIFVIYCLCYRCNKCILIHKTYISFHISTRFEMFAQKKMVWVVFKRYCRSFLCENV
jgi:hypothetical protein